ncbi:MAG: hypothetical protein VR70_10705 [Rhodospirillaceae bacterium BRH_c57]|nr:MAG: hypothetical protein VR70_10705 [Rhodospirillaceae bacterium BRH_c57]
MTRQEEKGLEFVADIEARGAAAFLDKLFDMEFGTIDANEIFEVPADDGWCYWDDFDFDILKAGIEALRRSPDEFAKLMVAENVDALIDLRDIVREKGLDLEELGPEFRFMAIVALDADGEDDPDFQHVQVADDGEDFYTEAEEDAYRFLKRAVEEVENIHEAVGTAAEAMDGRQSENLRRLFADIDLLKRIEERDREAMGFLTTMTVEDGIWQDAFVAYMEHFGDHVAEKIARDVRDGWLQWLHAALPRLTSNLLASSSDQAAECLVVLGTAFPDKMSQSRSVVERLRQEPAAFDAARRRVSANQAASAKPGIEKALQRISDFERMVAETSDASEDLPSVTLHGAMAAASAPVSEPPPTWFQSMVCGVSHLFGGAKTA